MVAIREVGFQVAIRGIPEVRRGLQQLEKQIVNETRRELRAALKPLVTDLRAAAPVRSGKLASSVRNFSTSNLSFGVRYGRRASKTAVGEFLARWGPVGSRGGTKLTQGRISEAFYVHAVAKGHVTPQGSVVLPRKWVYPVVAGHVGRLRREVEERTERLAAKFEREFRPR